MANGEEYSMKTTIERKLKIILQPDQVAAAIVMYLRHHREMTLVNFADEDLDISIKDDGSAEVIGWNEKTTTT